MPLDYNNSIPLYVQLKERIEKNILNGKYEDKIPSEREVMDEFYVSRSTVRQAINELVNDGVLEKRPGKGTFISLKPINDWLGSLSSTSETIKRMGMEPGAKLIKAEQITLPSHLQKIIGSPHAFHFKRIRFANQTPIGIENNYYSLELGEKINKFDLNNITLYDLLELKLGIHTKQAEQNIRAGKVSNEDAVLLNVPRNTAILEVDRKLVDINDRFVEFEQAFYRADMYSFKINLARNN
ncbi:GntR family transcriptional regulator [Oceanobacillus sp. J11TS1]|uniref:GntR family transcriptional regulator n=1 Tax=Oceanobacillus sp. J11TS1 TaxID=2807191 RepID=UPI001B1C2E61|nr:GntR family transcriptional regulator [Oceanobacillus sp. J11TS1]GIO23435.1 GntR family transcriptional regulator [Oceanobacillus sp. J11TS1]